MRGTRTAVLILTVGVCLAGSQGAGAGVYNPAEAPLIAPGVENPYELFRDRVLPLRPIGVPVPPAPAGKDRDKDPFAERPISPIARRYDFVAALAPRAGAADLTAEQALSLGDYLIRSKKYRQAASLLEGIYRKKRSDPLAFLLLATLATAEQLDAQGQPGTAGRDQFRRAADYLGDALRAWPKDWDKLPDAARKSLTDLGWKKDHLAWFRRAEEYQRKLLDRRSREPAPKVGEYKPLGTEVDALFDDGGKPPQPVRFVGESGKYEAGALAAAEKKKLPDDAIKLVQQLILWMPDDMRLYWLLAELYNARGEYQTALTIYDLIRSTLSPRVEGLGVRILQEQEYPEAFRTREAILRAAKERADAEMIEAAKKTPAPRDDAGKSGQGKDPKPAAGLPFDLRSLGVGFGIGIIAGLLGYWQVREIRRRVQARAMAGKE